MNALIAKDSQTTPPPHWKIQHLTLEFFGALRAPISILKQCFRSLYVYSDEFQAPGTSSSRFTDTVYALYNSCNDAPARWYHRRILITPKPHFRRSNFRHVVTETERILKPMSCIKMDTVGQRAGEYTGMKRPSPCRLDQKSSVELLENPLVVEMTLSENRGGWGGSQISEFLPDLARTLGGMEFL